MRLNNDCSMLLLQLKGTICLRLWVVMIVGLTSVSSGKLQATVQSDTGVILFKPDSNQTRMSLTEVGLGIGVTPSANLHVSGNMRVSQNVAVGSVEYNSSLSIDGSIGFGIQSLLANGLLSDSSMVLVDTSSSNISVTLPYAGNVTGRVYTIKKTSALNVLTLVASSGNFENSFNQIQLRVDSNGSLPSIRLLSDGDKWVCLSKTANEGVEFNLTPGLIRYYKFDETSAAIASDSSLTQDHISITGGLTFGGNSGVINNALVFVGNTAHQMATTFGSGLNPSVNHLTYSIWAKTTAVTQNSVFFGTSGGANQRCYVGITGGAWGCGIQASAQSSSEFKVGYNQWTHLALVVDGSQATLYVDGVAGSTANTVKSYTSYTFPSVVYIGNSHNLPFNGSLDEVRIYDRALSSEEVISLYDLGR